MTWDGSRDQCLYVQTGAENPPSNATTPSPIGSLKGSSFIPRLNAKNDVTGSNKLSKARGFSDSQTSKSALGHFIQIA